MSANESMQRLTTELAKVLPEVNDGLITIRSLAILEGDLALVAVESIVPSVDASEKCNTVATNHPQLARTIGVKRLIFVKWDAVPERFVANAFVPVTVIQVRFESDAITGQTIAKVLVDEAGFDAIFDLDAGERRLARIRSNATCFRDRHQQLTNAETSEKAAAKRLSISAVQLS